MNIQQGKGIFSLLLFFSVLLVSPYFVFAQSVGQKISVVDLQSQIQALLKQIQILQQQVATLQAELGKEPEKTSPASLPASTGETPAPVGGSGTIVQESEIAPPEFTHSLSRGSSGDDVRKLQEFLAKDKEIYPDGLITGYFGPKTESAVKKWQEKHGIESIGIIGPKSIAKLKDLGKGRVQQLLEQGAGASGIIPPGLLIAPGIQKRIEVSVTTTPELLLPLVSAVSTTSIAAATSSAMIPAQPVPSTNVGVVSAVSATPATPTQSTDQIATTADTTPPTISDIQTSDLTAPENSLAKATITWTTNESSNSWIYYATVSLSATTTPSRSGDNQNLTSHSISLTNLYYVTTYYYVVVSKDIAGNTATSSERSFLTAAQYTPSGLTISNLKAVSPYYEGTQIIDNLKMTITWDTNVRSSTRVEYGLTPAYGQSVDWNEDTSHSVTLTQLDVGETYYYRVQSGTTISSGQTFTTPFGGTTVSTIAPVSQSGSSPPVMCKLKYDGAIMVTPPTVYAPRFVVGVLTDKPAAVNFKMSKNSSMSQPFINSTDGISSYAIHNFQAGGVATGTTYYLQLTVDAGGSSVISPIYPLTLDDVRYVPGAYTLYSDLTTPFCPSLTSQFIPLDSREKTFASVLKSLQEVLSKLQGVLR